MNIHLEEAFFSLRFSYPGAASVCDTIIVMQQTVSVNTRFRRKLQYCNIIHAMHTKPGFVYRCVPYAIEAVFGTGLSSWQSAVFSSSAPDRVEEDATTAFTLKSGCFREIQ